MYDPERDTSVLRGLAISFSIIVLIITAFTLAMAAADWLIG